MAPSNPSDWVWVPPGVIIPWAGTDIKKIPENWALAVGTSYDRGSEGRQTEYGPLFNALGFKNGGSGNMFNTPNLQGKFVRGHNTLNKCFNDPNEQGSLDSGQVYKSKTGASDISIEMADVPSELGSFEVSAGSSVQCMDRLSGGWKFDLSGTDAETRPNNIAMNWIIKLRDLPKGRAQDVPIGGLVSFAGDPNDLTDGFPALILAEGGAADNTDVPDLNLILGTNYAINKNSKTTSMPDVRGQFIRGWTNSGNLDPDWMTRTPAPGAGSVANGVAGSTQNWGTKLPANASLTVPWFNGNSVSTTGCYGGSGSGATHKGVSYGDITESAKASGGAIESRPPNAAITWYVSAFGAKYEGDKYTPESPKSYFPVGSVITIPGDPDPSFYLDKKIWLPCAGGEYAKSEFPALAKVLLDRWGKADDDSNFRVPNLQGQFLRGRVDKSGTGADPEYNKRLDVNGNEWNSDLSIGTGSYQRSATGRPSKLGVAWTWGNPTATSLVMGGNHHNVSEPNPNFQTYKVDGSWDNEAAPACVIVTYWIRAA